MPEPLRFAFVTTFYPPHHFGGDAVLVRHMAEALARAGHRVDVVYDADAYLMLRGGGRTGKVGSEPEADPRLGRSGGATASPAAAGREQAGDAGDNRAEEQRGALAGEVRVHALRSRLGRLSPLLTHQLGRPLVHRRFLRRLLEEEADVVHFHNVSLAGGPGVLAYGGALKLYTAHEHWLVCPTHVLWRHRREPCTERQCLRCLLHYRRPPQLWRLLGALDRAARHVDAFCSPSQFSIDKHAELGFRHPMRLLPPFLPDESPHESKPLGAPSTAAPEAPVAAASATAATASRATPAAPIFLFLGRLERIKGLHDVIPVFASGGGRENAELWIAGAGPEEAALRELAGASPRIRFLGFVEPDRVRELLRAARALIVPSAGFEVFPLVLLEAFREGTPVIARRLGPLPEVVATAGGGLTFATVQELGEAVARLDADPHLARELGASARKAFVEHWSERTFLSRYHALVAELARERKRRQISSDPAACPTPRRTR